MTAGMRERRYPTGLTTWGPLPGTGIMHILWPGPGSGLFLVTGQPDTAGVPVTRIEHASASGTYDTAPGHAGQPTPSSRRTAVAGHEGARLTRPRTDGARPRWLPAGGAFALPYPDHWRRGP
jgi:hypothetical protein